MPLRDEKALLDFLENGDLGLHWVDANGTILWANRADYEPLGYTADEYVGHNITEFHADPAAIADILERLTAGEALHGYEARLRCKDGSIRLVSITSSVRFDENEKFLHTRCFTLDITDRKRTEEALRQSEDRLCLALEAGQMGTWDWDLACNRVYWSPTLEQIHGLPVGSFDGTFEAYQRDIHPGDKHRVLTTIEDTLRAGKRHYLSYRIVRPDGAVRWLEAHGRVICDADGKPSRVVGVCMDATERKEMEEAREKCIGILGHDLRNPLSTVIMGSALLLRQATLGPPETQVVAKIARSAERMERMIVALLDFARGRLGGGIPVSVEPVKMDEVCERVIEELELAQPGRKILFQKQGDMRGQWDPGRLAQAISNLVANALTHGEDPIKVSVRDGGASVMVEISNQGPAIPPDVLTTLFQPFRHGREREAGGLGLGLGLYIVREIVRAHGGTIDVRSSELEGTTVVVKWPRNAATTGAGAVSTGDAASHREHRPSP